MNTPRHHPVPVRHLLVLQVLATSALLAAESSWPQFHGPGRSNISPESGLLKKWPEGGPRLLWSYDQCGRGYSGVTIADGAIYTAGDFGECEKVVALDMGGNLLWEAPNGRPWRGACPGSRATPTWDSGTLYHMSPNGRLAAFDARAGNERWAVDLVARFDASFGIWGLAENILVDGDRVFCMPGGIRGRVVALDKRTGATLWANTEIPDTAAYCSPMIITHRGQRQLVSMTQKSVVALAPDDGRLLWSAPFVPRSPQNALTPVYHDGRVFVACGHSSGGSLLEIDDARRTATPLWHREDLDNCHGGALLIEGRLYGSACRQGGKKFYCVDFRTGRTIQLDDTLGKVGITCADGMLYCLNHQGTMSLLAMSPSGFDIVSQFDLGKKPANSYLAHPVVCGGRLYVRCNQQLRAFDVRAP